MTAGCASSAAHEELLTLLDMIEHVHVERMSLLQDQRHALLEQLSANDKEICTLTDFAQFASTLRAQVEAGKIPAEAALTELSPAARIAANESVPRRFNSAEFISTLHAHGRRKAS